MKPEKKRKENPLAGRVSGLAEGGEGEMGLTKAAAGLQKADGHLPDQRREVTGNLRGRGKPVSGKTGEK